MTQETATNHVCHGALTPVAMPRRRRRRLASDALRHTELRLQYITPAQRLGTLMRHFFCRSRLPIALLAPGMGQAPLGRVLIAPSSLALRHAPCLIPTPPAAVALAPVAVRAHQHHAVAMRARERASAPDLSTRHWRSP